MVRHLLSLKEYSAKEIEQLINNSFLLKKLRRKGIRIIPTLRGKTIALIFEKPSTRTRASFSVATWELGALPIIYRRDELQLIRGEPIKDLSRVLSRYHDAIAARVFKHRSLEDMAKYSSVPIINLLSDKYHPLQALADLMTILEKKGHVKGLKLAFIGDGTDNVLNSLIISATKLGLEIHVAAPKEYWPKEDVLKEARENVHLTEDPIEAIRDADIVYTDVFVSMGQEHEREKRLKVFLPRYQVKRQLLEYAKPDFIFMHCLPAHRGEEVTEDVIEDKQHSVVFDQAENRLHTSKAILLFLLGNLLEQGIFIEERRS